MTASSGNTAVLLMDCMEGTASTVLADAEKRAAFVASAQSLLALARRRSFPIIRVEVEFRPGHPEVAPTNAFFSGAKAAGRLVAGSEQTEPMGEFAEEFLDAIRVVKRRIGGFAGSDLEWVLRGLGCTKIAIAGLVTRGAVLSTACLAADLDYGVTVVSDACHDPDPNVHQTLLTGVLPLRAAVQTVAEFDASLEGQS